MSLWIERQLMQTDWMLYSVSSDMALHCLQRPGFPIYMFCYYGKTKRKLYPIDLLMKQEFNGIEIFIIIIITP